MAKTETKAAAKVVDAPVAGGQATVPGGDGATTMSLTLRQNASVNARNGYRWLLRGGICLVCFGVTEVFSRQPLREPDLPPLPFDAAQAHVFPGDASLSETIERYERHQIPGPMPPAQPEPDGETPIVRGWRAVVQKNWDLKGTSSVLDSRKERILEAIIFDNRVQRLQFLRVGQTVHIAGQEVAVSRVEADRVELRRGDEILVLD